MVLDPWWEVQGASAAVAAAVVVMAVPAVMAVVMTRMRHEVGDLLALLGVEHVVDLLGDGHELGFELLEGAPALVEPAVDGALVELLRLQDGAELLFGAAVVLAVLAHEIAGLTEGGANHLLLTGRGVEAAEGPIGSVAPVTAAASRQVNEASQADPCDDESEHFFSPE